MQDTLQKIIIIIMAGAVVFLAVKTLYLNQYSDVTYTTVFYDNVTHQAVEHQETMSIKEASERIQIIKLIDLALMFALIGVPAIFLKRKNNPVSAFLSVLGLLAVIVTESMWLGYFISIWMFGGLYVIVAFAYLVAIIGVFLAPALAFDRYSLTWFPSFLLFYFL